MFIASENAMIQTAPMRFVCPGLVDAPDVALMLFSYIKTDGFHAISINHCLFFVSSNSYGDSESFV